jgi:hypothetical protein
METRQFKFGGLEITMYKHSQHGWVTTPQELADVIGITLRQVRNNLKKYGVIDSDRGLEDETFAKQLLDRKNISRLENEGHARKMSKIVLTVKGMIFLTQLARTPMANQFRKEVLETIEGVEAMGHQSFKDLSNAIVRLETKSVEDSKIIVKMGETIAKLTDVVFELKHENTMIKEAAKHTSKANKLKRSANGKNLAASKAEKKAEALLH